MITRESRPRRCGEHGSHKIWKGLQEEIFQREVSQRNSDPLQVRQRSKGWSCKVEEEMTAYFPWFLVDYLFPPVDFVDLGLEEHDDSVEFVPSATVDRMGIVMYHD